MAKATSAPESIENIKSAHQKEINDLKAKCQNQIDAANAKVLETETKLAKHAKYHDALKAQHAELESQFASQGQQLAESKARVGFAPGDGFEVVLTMPAPFEGKTLPVGTVIGHIVPIAGAGTDYVVDAVRTNYAKCRQCEPAQDAADQKQDDES